METSEMILPKLSEIKKSIPRRCFSPKTRVSFGYLLRNILMIVALYLLAISFPEDMPLLFKGVFWAVYILLQGTLFFGLFLLGHDYGHGAFSKNRKINNVAGIFVHSILLLPFTPWKLTHRNHHRFCGHFNKDEGYGPVESGSKVNRKVSALMAIFGVAYWCYMFGISRHGTNHYSLNDPLFKSMRKQTAISLAVVLCVFIALIFAIINYGFVDVFLLYIAPLQVYTYYFMVVTFLQHNNEELIWYNDKEWGFLKGSLTTIDRDYKFLNGFLYNTGLHQIHHLIPSIPHYHLIEATHHFRKSFPDLVHISHENPILAYFKNLTRYARDGEVPEGDSQFSYAKKNI